MSFVEKILEDYGYIRKTKAIFKTDEVLPEYYTNQGTIPRPAVYDTVESWKKAGDSWVIQEIYRAILQEFRRPKWEFEPRFKYKCTVCGTEYETDPTSCHCKNTVFDEPDYKQKQYLKKMFTKINSRRRTFWQQLWTLGYNDLLHDKWYLSVDYAAIKPKGKKNRIIYPSEMKVNDPAYIQPVVDSHGEFNSNEWFCPVCWTKDKPDMTKKPGKCKKCGVQRKRTAYVQKIQNEVTARWSLDEMVVGYSQGYAPKVQTQPRLRSLWNIVNTLMYMDQWFMDTFSDSRVQKIVSFPNYDQAKVTALLSKIQADAEKQRVVNKFDKSRRSRKSLRTVFIGAETDISVHDVGIKASDVALLDYYRMAIQAACGVYGCQPIFIAFVEKGKAGTTPAMQIEVANRTIEELQASFEMTINTQLMPIFGITDWVFKFGPLEKKDEVRDADILQKKVGAATGLASMGFDVWWDDDDALQWSRKPTHDPEMVGPDGKKKPGIGETIPPKKESGASRREINATTTERTPHGPRESSPNAKKEVDVNINIEQEKASPQEVIVHINVDNQSDERKKITDKLMKELMPDLDLNDPIAREGAKIAMIKDIMNDEEEDNDTEDL